MTEQATITPADAIAALGLTVEAVFIPFSLSRNKGEKHRTLNWRVTLKRNGREIMTTDYSAGEGHCPASATEAPPTYRGKDRHRSSNIPYPGTTSAYRAPTKAEALRDYLDEWRAAECESGVAMEYEAAVGYVPFAGMAAFKPKLERKEGQSGATKSPIQPDPVNVIWCLQCDAGVIDYGTFEQWAADFGYDADSRSAEATYRACLETALKLRAGIGEEGLRQLQEAFQDY